MGARRGHALRSGRWSRHWRLAVTAAAIGITGFAALPAAAALDAPVALDAPPPPPPPTQAVPQPCNPVGTACSVGPTALSVTLQPPSTAIQDVQVSWATPLRPNGSPGPAQPNVILPLSAGHCTPSLNAPVTCTWPWPTTLDAPGSSIVLNGTYAVATCSPIGPGSGPRSPTGPSSTVAPPPCAPPSAGFQLAAPPGSPSGFHVQAAGAASGAPVDVSWSLGPEPDLAAYTVSRDGTAIYRCALHGAAISGAAACPSHLGFTDRSAGGRIVTYGITAERFGIDGNPAHDVVSAPTVATIIDGVTINSPGNAGSRGGGSGGAGALPPVPYFGSSPTLPGLLPPQGGSSGSLGGPAAAGSPATTDPGYGNLPFGAKSRLSAGALASEAGHGTGDVHGLALIAGGLLLLALAFHLLYLRGAIGRYQDNLAAGRDSMSASAGGGGRPPGPPAHRRGRSTGAGGRTGAGAGRRTRWRPSLPWSSRR